jgi:hypothetical protein
MSHVVPLSKINQFLPVNKLQVPTADHDDIVKDLEETARDIVVAKLSELYDTSGWSVNKPSLVSTIIGMLTAGWIYDRQFSEEVADRESYGSRRVREAYALLEGIISGAIVLDGVPQLKSPTGDPSTLETEPVFEMETVF